MYILHTSNHNVQFSRFSDLTYFLTICSLFFSVQCKRGERWLGGEFISAERVVIWSDDGKAYLYKLPTNCIVESKAFNNRSKTQAGGKDL